MTTKRPTRFDRGAATLWLLAALAGLGVGAAARTYVSAAAPAIAPSLGRPPGPIASEAPTIVVVHRAATQPVARTRAS